MRSAPTQPYISCIVTAFNEGSLSAVSLNSILNQSFEDFEVIVVEDGACEQTRATLDAFDDPRIVRIRQANDGLSSSRNRGLRHARGDYICFLDADDTRPVWAFGNMAAATLSHRPDCVFSPGLLCELGDEVLPFYDQHLFMALTLRDVGYVDRHSSPGRFIETVRLLACVEPQSGNKLVRRDFLEARKLRFPNGLFFEDLIFHNGVIMSMQSVAVTELPTFTYYRRYGRPQITSSRSTVRFDAISSSGNLFDMFSKSQYFQDVIIRNLLIASTFKLLKWCEGSTSHQNRDSFRQALSALVLGMDQRYYSKVGDSDRTIIESYAPWVNEVLSYFESLVAHSLQMTRIY